MRIKILFVVLLSMLIVFTCARAAKSPNDEELTVRQSCQSVLTEKKTLIDESIKYVSSAQLPTSLTIIDDSAFEGTALVSVEIPESVTYIGDYAFANIPSLLGIHIPDTTQFIGKDAFIGSREVTLSASSGSYAKSWAAANGYRFQLISTFTARDGIIHYSFQNKHNAHPSASERIEQTDTQRTNVRERRTGRSVGDLKAAQYKGVAALYVQSRYFP